MQLAPMTWKGVADVNLACAGWGQRLLEAAVAQEPQAP
jgi:hypothetical protein